MSGSEFWRHLHYTRQWHPTPVLLPGKSHGWRSLEGCSPWGRWGSDTTERLLFHFSLSRIGEGNGNPLQCSCLENPRDRGAWRAAVYGVTQSWTWLKWLSSSSSNVPNAVWCWSYAEGGYGPCNQDYLLVEDVDKYSGPLVSLGSASADSTNCRSKMFFKNSRTFQKAKLKFVMRQQLFT